MKVSHRSVQNVKNSLKFKAQPKPGILSVKVGVKKYQIPIDARLISGERYLFLSFPACSELFEVEGRSIRAMEAEEDASMAYDRLSPHKRKGKRRGSHVEMPPALAEALKNLPSGFKLGYGNDGIPKLVKSRKRTVKKSA